MTSWGTIRSFYQKLFLMKYLVCSSEVRKDKKKKTSLFEREYLDSFFLKLKEFSKLR